MTNLLGRFKNIVSGEGSEKLGPALVDLCSTNVHILTASLIAGGRPFLLKIVPSSARGWFGTSFEDHHPFVATARQLLANPGLNYSDTDLFAFHRGFQPRNAAERVGLPIPALTLYPPYAAVLPWQAAGPSQRQKRFEDGYAQQNVRRGKYLPLGEGVGAFGPVSPAKGEIEVRSILNLLRSLSRLGYKPDATRKDGHINVYALVGNDGTVKYLVKSGHHRMATLIALDYPEIPVRLEASNIIRRSECAYWPNVLSGIFEQSEALELFDAIFEGLGPHKMRGQVF